MPRIGVVVAVLTALVVLGAQAPKPTQKPAAGGAAPAPAPAVVDEPLKIATEYLKALDGSGDSAAREYLLGGTTLTADEYTIPNWKIVEREPAKVEEGDIKDALAAMKALDAAGRKTLSAVVNLDGDDVGMVSITQEQAEKMLAPTRAVAEAFEKRFPVFAYCARVNKDVYWHPSNPWRSLVVPKLGESGPFRLDFHLFRVEEKEPGQKPRVWPLRVFRVKTKTYDSGWKVLPASDWDPEY